LMMYFEEDRRNLGGGELDDDDQETLEELEELLAVEFENKVRETGDESKLTIDPFLLEYGIEPEYVTGFGWASIMNKRESIKICLMRNLKKYMLKNKRFDITYENN